MSEKSATPDNKHNDIRWLRILLTVMLAILSVIMFSIYISLKTISKATDKDFVVQIMNEVNFLDVELGELAQYITYDGFDENSTVTDVAAVAISKTASEQFGYDISQDQVEALLEDEKFREDIGEITGDVVSGVMTGQVNADELAEDVQALIVDNRDQIQEISGYEISDELVKKVYVTVSDMDNINVTPINIGGNSYNTSMNMRMSMIPPYAPYIYLGLGVVFCCIVIVLNRYRLATGTRAVGIACLVVGFFNAAAGLIIKIAPAALLGLSRLMLRSLKLPDLGIVFEKAINSFTELVSREMLIPSAIFAGIGVALMIAQGIIAANYRNN